ncbi:hypothetical protein GCM10023187_14820 [Nibrella viscosa]|uniref:Uncharacterized protein n=1 Tax=Nibrella viscosa TaxID=1084524 RepID=A0ABP8K6L4_9BACT
MKPLNADPIRNQMLDERKLQAMLIVLFLLGLTVATLLLGTLISGYVELMPGLWEVPGSDN